jgi:hypothetical protein
MITLHTEIRLNGTWEHLATKQLTDHDGTLWPTLHKYGDTYVRVYSKVTMLDIKFQRPDCYVHHFSKQAMLATAKELGEQKANKIFGYLPWDSIFAYEIEEDVNDLVTQHGITGVRAIAWRM